VYRYSNGSQIVVGGMDKASKVMSTEYDLIYVQEAIELLEEDFESLTTRLRNGVLPYQQLLADTNPDTPTHWLKRRCDSGRTTLLQSRHEDNPTVTPEYIAKLENLTGPRYQRLRWGHWVQAEGVVYDGWDPAIHLLDRFDIPWTWPRYWSIDFGYTNPFVCQFWAQDPDGRFHHYHHWSHADAVEHTEAVSGFGRGIYVSHLFTLVWTADVLSWWLQSARRALRPSWIDWLLHGFMAFVIFNATVIYETGPIRWAGLTLFTGLAGVWLYRSKSGWSPPSVAAGKKF
jgi:hypothetical protein